MVLISYAEENLRYLYSGLKIVFDQFENFSIERFVASNRSTAIRYEQILYAVEHQDVLPIIGVGIGKSVLYPETFYAMYYYRTGLLGIFMHFGIICYTIYCSLFFSKKCASCALRNKHYYNLMAFFFSIAIYFSSFIFAYLSTAINDSTRSGFIFYVLIAIVVYYKKNYKIYNLINGKI
jgi:hypothetical protein